MLGLMYVLSIVLVTAYVPSSPCIYDIVGLATLMARSNTSSRLELVTVYSSPSSYVAEVMVMGSFVTPWSP